MSNSPTPNLSPKGRGDSSRTALKAILLFLIAVLAGYFLTIFITPRYILLKIKFNSGSKMNVPVYSDIISDKDRHVVMPNPDFLYVASGYNLLNGPIRISGKMSDSTYSSVSFYADNTLNYYIRNDRQTPNKKYSFILTRDEEDKAKYPNEEVIVSPSWLGTILTRTLIDRPENIEQLKEIQRSFKVEELN
ncbi:MAG: hypothetical protein POELPBGB_02778 [Bacteroidia bacterium]|nr:hypothetical protein [Bacteroidia bacterium]